MSAPRPTPRGWVLALAAVGLAGGGRLLGVSELFGLSAAAGTLVLGALAYVTVRRVSLVAGRSLRPARVTAGGATAVELVVRNTGRFTSPALELADGPTALVLGPLGPGEVARPRYRLAAPHRGVMAVGPLRMVLTDPFGMATRTVEILGAGSLIVHPWSTRVMAPPRPPGSGAPGLAVPAGLSRGSDELHAVRPYRHGDDLRRIHWPTTARTDELAVREDEAPRPWECLIALDLRLGVHDRLTLEATLSAAATVARSCAEEDGQVRMLSTGGPDSGLAGGPAHLETMLDGLALARLSAATGLGALVNAAGRQGDSRTVVLITTTSASAADLGLVARLRGPAANLVVVRTRHGRGQRTALAADHVVDVDGSRPFPAAWDAVLTDPAPRW